MHTRGMVAEDLYELKSVKNPVLSPVGKRFVFVQTVINKEKHDYQSHIFVGEVEGGKVNQWTFGDVKDNSPSWSPDGKWIAFASNRSGKSQLYLLRANGGEAKQVTFCKNGATNPVWSPDSSKLLFETHLAKAEKIIDRDEGEKEDPLLEPMVVERIRYKSDAVGFLDDKNQHVAVVDVVTGEVEQLTDGERDYAAGCWSPDGSQITVTADLSDDPDYKLVTDIFLLPLSNKKLSKVTNSNGFFGLPTWSPDGNYLAFIGHEKEFESATLSRLWLYDIRTADLRCLTSEWDVQVGDVAIGDFHSGTVNPGAIWTSDSKGFYFIASEHGNTGIYYRSIDGEPSPVLVENQHVYGVTVNPNTHEAIVAISTPTLPGDLFHIDFKSGKKQQITYVNADMLSGIELSQAEAITFQAPDGWDIHGWVMKPIGYKEGKKYPTIMEVHGGPHAMYANTYFHEFQMLAAKGFVVVFTNPRGSHGYGQTFVDAVRGDYGGKDYLDVMAATDFAVTSFDFVDETNLGITGGSYGGFMTNWVVGHTQRFKAAVTQRSISNWLSFYGVSDIGYYFSEWEVKGDLITDTEKLWKHSPLAYVDQIETPLLILHGEKDYRCPIEQAEQLFVALKRQKKPTTFVRFPESNHELSRSGKPNLRLERLNHIQNWFVKYLL
ncbi:S9 family peptidase [Alkalihalobacillus sp. MEB130]|uniref:S9 family peptidase n=1 Tax=Alkalihalobacillus sp. MEB130 TaxID=2976704 RepID=UPI0028E0056A|nr:S9 family peptidase [Alkalihalobacillus sp. MEB130]MDT8859667.1 S9 family peptidase [Alkalihalobacillus sp. MEB130]